MPYFRPFFQKQTNNLIKSPLYHTQRQNTPDAIAGIGDLAVSIHLPAKIQPFFFKCVVAILSNKTIQGKAKID